MTRWRRQEPATVARMARGKFDPVGTKPNKWTPSADHYPILKSAGGNGRNEWTAAMVRKAYVS